MPPNSSPPAFIDGVNANGQQIKIARAEWREKVLLPNLKAAWNDPIRLADLIQRALWDQFLEETIEPSRHLLEIGGLEEKNRAVAYLGHALRNLRRFGEAKEMLEKAIEDLGPTPIFLSNLGLTLDKLGDAEGAERALWQALELDPNDKDALLVLANRGTAATDPAAKAAIFARAATLPGAWQPLLWQARSEVEGQRLDAALALYQQAAQRAGKLPGPALEMITGDLGRTGHPKEATDFCGPLYEPAFHGPTPGNNLIRAYMDVGKVAEARGILELMYAQNRPDWNDITSFWENAIGKQEHSYGEPNPAEMKMEIKTIEMPIWQRPGIEKLIPPKPGDAPLISVFLGSLAKNQSGGPAVEEPDVAGRLSRAVPAYLAEQIAARTNARCNLIAVLTVDGGFVVTASPETPAALSHVAADATYALQVHVDATQSRWSILSQLVRVRDQRVVDKWKENVDLKAPTRCAADIAVGLLKWLGRHAGVKLDADNGILKPPGERVANSYLLLVEQELAIRAATLVGEQSRNLISERSILENAIDIVKFAPESLLVRLHMWAVYEEEAARRPDIGREFLDRVLAAHAAVPLPGFEAAFKVYEDSVRKAIG